MLAMLPSPYEMLHHAEKPWGAFLSHWSKFGAKSQIYYFGDQNSAFTLISINVFTIYHHY